LHPQTGHNSCRSYAPALKGDAIAFARTVKNVEGILLQAGQEGTLAAARDACAALQECLEEGLAYCHRLQTQYFITTMLLSGRDAAKFRELSEQMRGLCQVVCTAASVSTAAMVLEDFQQGKQLQGKIAQLGGPDAVAKDPALRDQVSSFMKESDQLMLGAVEGVKLQVQQSQKELEGKLEEQSLEARKQHEVMAMQIEKLTGMMSALVQHRGGLGKGGDGAGEGEGDGEVEVEVDAAAAEAAVSAATVRDVLRKMPVRGDEADRLAAVEEAGLGLDQSADFMGDAELERLVAEALDEFDAGNVWVGGMDATHQLEYAHVTRDAATGGTFSGSGGVFARELTFCQHTIEKDDAVQHNGDSYAARHCFGAEEMAAMAPHSSSGIGEGLQGFGALMSGAAPPMLPMPNGREVDARSVADHLSGCFAAPEHHYTSVPIRVRGKAVATFCVMDRKRRDDLAVDSALDKVKAYAAKAEAVIQRRAARLLAERAAVATPANFPALGPVKAGKVVRMDADSFAAVALDPARDVAVLLVAPGCAHCAAAKQQWAAAAARHAAGAPVFAVFDVRDADPPHAGFEAVWWGWAVYTLKAAPGFISLS
jgi:hypothetical protein